MEDDHCVAIISAILAIGHQPDEDDRKIYIEVARKLLGSAHRALLDKGLRED